MIPARESNGNTNSCNRILEPESLIQPHLRKEERCKSCGGTPCVFTHPKNRHRKPTDHSILRRRTLYRKILPDTMSPEISPDTMPPEISPDTMPPDILPEAPAPPKKGGSAERGKKWRWRSSPAERGEKRRW